MMQIYNSLTRKKQEFVPLSPQNVGMYTCGPTVYDFVHIGNLRAYVFYDMLKRVLHTNGFTVKHVMNITDIDDKIIKKSRETGKTIKEIAKEYEDAFFEDIKAMNIIPADVFPRATEHIDEMVRLIQKLLEKGVAYKAEDGSVYFSIAKFPKYGSLAGLEKQTLKAGARVAADEYSKEDVRDFALWKAEKPGEPAWDAPFGRGRPGWHIECSAMSMKYLGETFDIHAGGTDLIFPHHEDEIAQSEAATGKPFVRYWVHNAHLLVDGQKMSKSLQNFYTLRDVKEKSFEPLALRYLYLTAHYRDQLNFTWDSLAAAQTALGRLRAQYSGLSTQRERTMLSEEKQAKIDEFRAKFLAAVNDDLNTPQAIAILWDTLKSNIPSPDKYDLLLYFDEVLGLDVGKVSPLDDARGKQVPREVTQLVEEREEMRKAGDFEGADKLRVAIQEKGYTVEDTEEGPRVK